MSRVIYAVAILVLTGCTPSMRSVGPALQHQTGVQASSNAGAILQALQRLRYEVVAHTPPTITAIYRRRAQVFRVRIDYGDGGYQISLVDSAGMNQGVDRQTGVMMISGRYHRYVRKLDIWIGRMLERGGGGGGSSGGSMIANERSIPLSYATSLGTVERALVLSGFEVETRRDDGGFITTAYVDSGQGYGRIDGDDATVHQRFTIVLSSTQVRVRMDLRKCATGGIFITSTLGRAAMTGRCEPMDLPADRGLRGRVRRELVAPFERLLQAIEREIHSEAPPEVGAGAVLDV
ncbi:MAG: hypothetical protein AB8H86_30155 [Polyangiales bacterium]